ncbi:MFS transporter [Leucobacter sp. wl10]|uniref:MFS transporter n=1 Tax=Leucobacter sp. wl10 TaxID=2304677 RepID=UPI0019695017|nr:MFS transporter [Leucobacter sp. wl10]
MARLIAVLVGGMILDGYILGILGPITGLIREDARLDDFWIGAIAAAPLFGIFVGSPLAGWATDKFGRKPMFIVDMGLFLVASALQFFVSSGDAAAVQLFAIRFLMGVAIGGEYAIGWPLMSEFAPPKLRGRLLGVTVVAWYVGFMIAFVVGTSMQQAGVPWRIILGSSTLLALVLFLARLGLPESPSWLITKGRRDEALVVARRYIGSSEMHESITQEIDLRMIQEARAAKEQRVLRSASFGTLFSPGYWRATLFTAGFWLCAVTPYFAIATFAVEVLKKYGLDNEWVSGVGLSALAAAGVVTSVLLVDKVGRRVLTVPTQWAATVLLLVIGLWSGAPPALVLTMFLAFSFINAMYNTLTQIYPSELFPSEVRGIGMGFAAAISRIGAALGTFALPWSMTNLGASTTMVIAAVIALAGALLSQWLAPETKGKTLAETAQGFSH